MAKSTKGKAKTELPIPGSLIRVEWEDCYTIDEWTPALLFRFPKQMDVVSVGFFVGIFSNKWVVASGIQVEDDEVTHGAATWVIPESLVLSWSAL